MKLKPKFLWPLVGLLSLTILVLTARLFSPSRTAAEPERKIAFYQDSMHPWIKAAQPGKCTICAMDLTPIYEGANGFDAGENMLVLSSNNITVLHVQTAEVQQRPLRRTLRVAGILEAGETGKRVISASRDGRVERLAVPYAGFEVSEGQPLANYFIPDLLSEARRYVLLAQNQTTMGKSGPMDMSNPLLTVLQNLRLYGLTEAQIEHLAQSGKAEGSFDILSPISGTVIERGVSEGQYVSQGTRLFTIVDLSVLWFRFDAYEQDLAWLHLGQQVELAVPSAPGQVFSGPIRFIEPFANETTRSAKVRVDVANPMEDIGGIKQRVLRQQQYAEGWVQVVTSNRLAIPSTAVLYPGKQAFVYVDKSGGAYEMRAVKLGRRGDQDWEVLSGLEEGENVVTSGNVLMDAQAQFNRGAESYRSDAQMAEPEPTLADGTTSHHHAPASAAGNALPVQPGPLAKFLEVADGISRALAADSVEQLRPQVKRLPGLLADLAKEVSAEHEWHPLIAKLQTNANGLVSTDLASARQTFLPFSTLMVELVQLIRAQEEQYRSLKVYHCPMAPKPGLWFQAKGPLQNPYYGAEMLRCGEEVKAPPAVAKKPLKAMAHGIAPTAPVTPVGKETSQPTTPMVMPTTSARSSPAPGAVPDRNFTDIPARTFSQAQPLNSRDHSAFENRLNNAVSARFSREIAATGTNTSRGIPVPVWPAVRQPHNTPHPPQLPNPKP